MTSTARRCMTVLLTLLLGALVLPAPARADQPLRAAAQITDNADALVGERAQVEAALARLQSETGLQLWVVFVDSFDGIPAQQWTDETASISDLGDRDALLAVATVDRAYAYSFPDDARISDRELTDVAADAIEPALSRGDWAGAVVAGADGYRAAATSSSGGGGLIWVLVVFLVVIAGAIIWVVIRRRRRAEASAPTVAGPSVEDLTAEANALLIELDDDLRQSERELSVAAGQYGVEATGPYREAVDTSRADVAEAFRLRMTLDEEPAPDLATRRSTLEKIIALCRQADERLDARAEEFDQLRDLEGRAAQVADEVDRRRTTAEAGLPAAEAAWQQLESRFGGAPVETVSANVTQARERLAFAASATARARAALAEVPAGEAAIPGDTPAGGAASPGGMPVGGSASPGGASAGGAGQALGGASGAAGGSEDELAPGAEAALAVRAAEDAVDQAERLIAAVHQAAADLDAARKAADALILEVEAELAAGRAAQAGPPPVAAGLAAAVAGAEQVLREVRAQLAADKPDPMALSGRLQGADSALDQALAEARDTAERVARARSLLAQALPVARSEVAAAGTYISTRRGVVDATARTSLSEAERHLTMAESLAASDPVTAVAEAQQAQQLASRAGRRALNDVQDWSGGSGGYDSGSLAGAILGGILAGDGGGGGYRGRSSRSGGGWSGGGFGGSSSRSRRTGSSSRGSSGGRRGGGGRF